MRWWLALVFAALAAVTAVVVAVISANRSEAGFRQRAEELAAGRSFGAAIEVGDLAATGTSFQEGAAAVSARRQLPVFVFSPSGRLLTSDRSRGSEFADIEHADEALQAALAGRRYVRTDDAVGTTLVGIPFRREGAGALVTYASHPLLAEGVGVVRDEVVKAALWAILLGGAIGFLVAILIARRLARIASAATSIEAGQFDTALKPWFSDEVGRLSASIDRMRKRLRDSFARVEADRSRLEELIERLDEGVIVVDRGAHVEFANGRARRLLENPLRSGDPVPDSLRAVALEVQRLPSPITETQIDAEGSRVYEIVALPPLGDSAAVLVVRDISERERREVAEREFVANAAHELRTPLTTITGAIEILQAGAKEDPRERDRFLHHIQRESERLVRLTSALLTLARAQTQEESPRIERVYARRLLESAAAAVTPGEGVMLTIRCDEDLELATQPELVEQSIINLAANAVKNTAEGAVVLSARRTDGAVAIEVADSGRGMRRAVRERVFERFYRGNGRDSDGFGLGMAIVRESVRVLGGRLEVESQPGVGTTVRMTLPMQQADSQ